eukprot:13456-Prymnesium_polylepis.1
MGAAGVCACAHACALCGHVPPPVRRTQREWLKRKNAAPHVGPGYVGRTVQPRPHNSRGAAPAAAPAHSSPPT